MRLRQGWRVLWAVAMLGGTAISLHAADPRSHVPVPARGEPSDIDPQAQFMQRLQKEKMFRGLRDQVNVDELIKSLKTAGIKPDSPEFAQLVRRALESNGSKLTDEQLAMLQKMLGNLFADSPPGQSPFKLPGDLPPPSVPDPPTGPQAVKPPDDPKAPDNTSSQQMGRLAQRLQDWSDTAKDSPILRQALGDLSRMVLQQGRGNSGDQLERYLATWNRLTQPKDSVSKGLSGFSMPALPSVELPRIPRPVTGAVASASGAAGRANWSWVMGVVAVAGGAVLIWKLLAGYDWKAKRAAGVWHPGPWPVEPGAVASRADLIRAFEYLSFLVLGRSARAWNHRAIAKQLGGDQTERQRAATQLAGLYEQARYAPADAPLPEQALADFRRDLCFLAGVRPA